MTVRTTSNGELQDKNVLVAGAGSGIGLNGRPRHMPI